MEDSRNRRNHRGDGERIEENGLKVSSMTNTNKISKQFHKMMGNPMEAIDELVKEAERMSNKDLCKCGNQKMDESDFCKECI